MTWVTALALAKRFWWAAPMLALSIALIVTRGTLADAKADLRQERAERTADKALGEKAVAAVEAGYAARLTTAATSYADRLAAREPIILRSTDTVRTYAETPAGRVLCLDADRVRGIDALDREFDAPPALPARGGAGTVLPDAGAPPGGRVGNQRR